MADRVELAFRRGAFALIPEGTRLLVAVSGGGDSVALLHLLRRFAQSRRLELVVAHLDHGLRRDSRTDRRFVERLARELGLSVVADRREVAALRRRDESPEEGARRVRRAFLLEAAREARSGLIATGHTLDDQAETVLMRWARGAGASALAGISPFGPGPFVRPLLEIERGELRDYLERHGLRFREDRTNRDLRYDRNRLRRLVLPVLAAALNPRAARHVCEAASRLREDSRLLDALASEAFERLARTTAGGLELSAAGLSGLDPALGKRVVRLALERAGADPRRIGARHVERLLDLARGGTGRDAHLPGRITARRAGTRLVLGAGRPVA